MSREVSPQAVLMFINQLFAELDNLVEEAGVMKVGVCARWLTVYSSAQGALD
jgi:hypothetical protein